MKTISVSATEIAALKNHSLDHVFRTCIMDLLAGGRLKDVGESLKEMSLKMISKPTAQHELMVAKFYKQRRLVREKIKAEVVADFLKALYFQLTDKGLLEKKSILRQKVALTSQGTYVLKAAEEWLQNNRKSFQRGLNKDLVTAFSLDPKFVAYFSERFHPILNLTADPNIKKDKGWFHATWYYANRYEAMRDALTYPPL